MSGPGAVEIPIDAAAELDVESWLVSLAGGVDLVDGERFTLQALGGVRYFDADLSLSWDLDGPGDVLPASGSAGGGVDAWDGIVGLRGEGRSGDWIFPYYVDVGAGDSELTWQAIVGAGYRWDWGDIALHYRYLRYEQEEGGPIEDIAFSGPALSATFRF